MSRGLKVPLSSASCISCIFLISLSLPGTSIPLWMMALICTYMHIYMYMQEGEGERGGRGERGEGREGGREGRVGRDRRQESRMINATHTLQYMHTHNSFTSCDEKAQEYF